MQSEVQSAGIYTDFAGLAKLKSEAVHQTDEARHEVAQQFEALFIQSMLKTMREATPGDDLTGNDQVSMYQDMFDKQLAIDLSKKGGIGIAEFMEHQLTPVGSKAGKTEVIQTLPERSVAFASRLWGQAQNSEANIAIQKTKTGNSVKDWESPEAFVNSLMPAARKAAAELGTSPEAVLAIAALETGWGKHVMPGNNGLSSHNLFGIKARPGDSDHVRLNTLEFKGGSMHLVKQPFRTYNSASESVEDFSKFIRENPRYSQALERSDEADVFIHEIHKAGYATDPEYTEKAVSVLKQIQSINQGAVAIADNSPQGS